jgi:TonB-dependent SusC/RagA subfamily outer membrane receptor
MKPLSQPALPRLCITAFLVVGCASGGGKQDGQSSSPPQPRASTVTSQDIHPAPDEPIEKALQGRVSGVDVITGADGGIAVRIRGQSSNTSTEPLYVLDGMVIQPGPGGTLSGINPRDIESIRVLKDPADLTMYGSRGANGVIVIKTKRGKPPQ